MPRLFLASSLYDAIVSIVPIALIASLIGVLIYLLVSMVASTKPISASSSDPNETRWPIIFMPRELWALTFVSLIGTGVALRLMLEIGKSTGMGFLPYDRAAMSGPPSESVWAPLPLEALGNSNFVGHVGWAIVASFIFGVIFWLVAGRHLTYKPHPIEIAALSGPAIYIPYFLMRNLEARGFVNIVIWISCTLTIGWILGQSVRWKVPGKPFVSRFQLLLVITLLIFSAFVAVHDAWKKPWSIATSQPNLAIVESSNAYRERNVRQNDNFDYANRSDRPAVVKLSSGKRYFLVVTVRNRRESALDSAALTYRSISEDSSSTWTREARILDRDYGPRGKSSVEDASSLLSGTGSIKRGADLRLLLPLTPVCTQDESDIERVTGIELSSNQESNSSERLKFATPIKFVCKEAKKLLPARI